jgi:hypothetical protein
MYGIGKCKVDIQKKCHMSVITVYKLALNTKFLVVEVTAPTFILSRHMVLLYGSVLIIIVHRTKLMSN